MRYDDMRKMHLLQEVHAQRRDRIPLSRLIPGPENLFVFPGSGNAETVVHDLKRSFIGLAEFGRVVVRQRSVVLERGLLDTLRALMADDSGCPDHLHAQLVDRVQELEALLEVTDLARAVTTLDVDTH